MRVALSLAALLLATGATPPPEAPTPQIRMVQPYNGPSKQVCRDRIHEVREDLGLPRLERDTASPDEPLFIAAVDKRIGGCSVMVMRNNLADVRPLPAPDDGPLLRRIPAQ